jgi:serine/threonine protein kinase
MKATFEEKYEYIDNDPISSGAYGHVYRIRDKKLKTEYVLKKLRKEDPNDPDSVGTDQETFENEVNFLINVKGTNIINIIDYYIYDKYYYIILEKMEGDLTKMINKFKNGMPSKLVRKIFLQLNTALKEMINNGKTHRDLKPSNILFSYTNDKQSDFIIKIGDFGLAADLVSTKTLSNAGTELFKAPEVGKGRFSNKCDLYSLGIILYMLKTGQYNFEGNDLFEKLANKNKNNIKKETDDPLLNNLIKKLVVIDPKDRMEWKNYFDDPFFNIDDDDIFQNNECKNNIKFE